MTVSKIISWRHDGMGAGGAIAASDFRGWTLEVDGVEAASVPTGWETDGQYQLPTSEMPVFASAGDYVIRMRLVTIGGASEWTAPVRFTLVEGRPNAPFALAVA